MGLITNCRICNSKNLELAIDLGNQPWCNNFLKENEINKEPYYPLRLVLCMQCRAAQLDYTVPKEVMFSRHSYLSGITDSLNNHFRKVASEVDSRFFYNIKKKSILDIGSNDGTQLKYYKQLGYRVLGIESCRTVAEIANAANIETINTFFNLSVAKNLKEKFHCINASGVFFHLEQLHSATEGIRHLLRKDGVFVVQFLYMKSIIENVAFDQIYHEHLLYYTLETIQALLKRHCLYMFDAYLSPIHGGSIIGFISHSGQRTPSKRLLKLMSIEEKSAINDISVYRTFYKRINLLKQRNIEYLKNKKAIGKKIFGLGAPAKGNTLLNYFGIDRKYLDCLVERNPLRKGLYSPGTHIPIYLEDEIKILPDVYYVLAWNFREEILKRYKSLIRSGIEFYFPINPTFKRK